LNSSLEEFISAPDFENAIECLEEVYKKSSNIYVAGNGGSAAIVQHFSVDWTKGISVATGKPLCTHSLVSNFSLITAISNDITNDQVFSFQISQYARVGDVALFVSSSGKSPNILNAIKTARGLGLQTVGISGNAGGDMRDLCNYNLFIRSTDTQIIEDTHNVFGHLILNHFSKKFGI